MRKVLLPSIISLALFHSIPVARADEPVFEAIELIKSKFNSMDDMVNCGDGYFYGVTRWADQYRGGMIYRVAPNEPVEVIHVFSNQQSWPVPNAGGSSPTTGLVIGADGAFYGATQGGGTYGWGTIYRITPDGDFSVLHNLQDSEAMGVSQLLAAPDGFIYGTGTYGGIYNSGRLFRISLGGTFEVLHDFGASSNPGWPPTAPLSAKPSTPRSLCLGADGKIYGTTSNGGRSYPTGFLSYSNSPGTLYRYDGPGQISVLTDFFDQRAEAGECVATPDGFHVTTDRQLLFVSFAGETTVLADFEADGKGDDVMPLTGIYTPQGFYGVTFYGGEHRSGFFYRYVPGQGVSYLHDFGPEFEGHGRVLALGNDGLIYGVAAVPEGGVGASASSLEAGSAGAKSTATGTAKAKGSKSFRFRDPATAPNFVPVAGNETVMLPEKPNGTIREVTVSVLANDRDPDGDPLSLAGVGDAGEGSVEIVQTKGRPSLRFSTSEIDPPSRKIQYQVADDMGGQAVGTLHLLSPAKGSYQGSGAGGADAGQLTVSIGAGNRCNVTFVTLGRRYSGKGTLDSSDAATIRLKTQGLPPAMLRLELERGATRQLKATIAAGEEPFTIICE